MSTKFEAPADPNKYQYTGENSGMIEPQADRVGQFSPEIGAHQDAADALPSHADLAARQQPTHLTEDEKAQGREEVERAKKILGYN